MTYKVEEVYRTEGVPEYTFVKPPNFNDILVDIRNPTKPVIIEGQSGTGKTTTVRKIIEQSLPGTAFQYLSARKPQDSALIQGIASGTNTGSFIVDDFHRLDHETQSRIANLVKVSAEDPHAEKPLKLVIIGINRVGSSLIHLVHDIAKRCGIHRIQPADEETTTKLIEKGEEKLKVDIRSKNQIFNESRGDYWLTQLLCQAICLLNDLTETSTDPRTLNYSLGVLRERVNQRLDHTYQEPVKEFCRGRRFRATNDPYYKLLRCVSDQDSSIVDVSMLANQHPEVRGSINNIKEKRLSILIESKPICERYFYYNPETKYFAIEDPALFYYLKHVNWDRLRKERGFKGDDRDFEFDIALSFAGENRDLARIIASQLETLDCAVFFDELFEANFLGKTWSAKFKQIFQEQSRFVVCLLDHNHNTKIWPTFERECFAPRVPDEAVIPVYLDDTVFVGIPKDLVGIKFRRDTRKTLEDDVLDNIVFKIGERLESA
jgi:hypothetical protein